MTSTELVRVFKVKRGKKERVITRATSEQLKNVHRRLLSLLTATSADLPSHVHGYVRGRSIATNASPHAGRPFLQKFDFRDFFENVHSGDIVRGLEYYGLGRDAAELVASLTTRLGRLPLGFATSPLLANISLYALDAELARYADDRSLTLSRYADDLAFSSSQPFDASGDIRAIVTRHGHSLREEKTKTLKFGQPLYVTGLSVSSPDVARLPRPMKARLRQHCYYIDRFGIDSHAERRAAKPEELRLRLAGLLSYARSVEPQWVTTVLSSYPHAEQVLFPRLDEIAEKRSSRLRALAGRIEESQVGRAQPYVPSVTYGDL
ncbi:MAG: reverse transcriptase family protein [Curtobacterium sp.]